MKTANKAKQAKFFVYRDVKFLILLLNKYPCEKQPIHGILGELTDLYIRSLINIPPKMLSRLL